MNYSTAVMLINPNIRAINVSYEPDTERAVSARFTFKTLDPTIEVGDYVVVPTNTRHEQTVCKVEEVDCEIDFEDPTPIKWIIDKVNTKDIEFIKDEEKKWVEALKQSEKRRRREEIKKNMLDMYKDDGIDSLPIANLQGTNDVRAIESSKEKDEDTK